MRDPQQVFTLSAGELPWDPRLVDTVVKGPFWQTLAELGITLLVSREYEHLVLALSCRNEQAWTSVLRLPHPSGIAVNRSNGRVFIACTRSPNQVIEFAAADGVLHRNDVPQQAAGGGLVPVATRFFPGCLYLHDLAFVAGRLMGNAVGLNAVVDLSGPGVHSVWWPRSLDDLQSMRFAHNTIQLNSLATSDSLDSTYMSASTERPGAFLPGDVQWEIDRAGVIFSGGTRNVVARGLTRPHSCRKSSDGLVFVDDSGYGTVNVVDGERTTIIAHLPGWTRGLCIMDRLAVVGTSRVIPKFACYAPGLDQSESSCGVHFVDIASGRVESSLVWPAGNQIFGIDWLPSDVATGFLSGDPTQRSTERDAAWYQFNPPGSSLEPQFLEQQSQ